MGIHPGQTGNLLSGVPIQRGAIVHAGITMDQMLASIDGVKHEEVQALVTQVIDEAQLALTTLGPLDRRNLPAELRN